MIEGPAAREAGGATPARLHALVVDDEPPLVRLLPAWPEREGFVVTGGPGWFGNERVVDAQIANPRQRLGHDPNEPRYVRTPPGVGYRMGPGS